MDEGTFVTFNLVTTNLPQNSVISFNFGGSLADEDVAGGLPESSFTVGANGKASLNMKLLNDKTTEGSENLTLTLNDDVTQTVSIVVNDTSIAVNHKPTGTALIKGDVKVGSVLTLTNTIKDADGLGDLSIQWETNAGILSSNESVTLTAKELGQQVWATVSYTDNAGILESVKSKLTAAVAVAKISTVSSAGNDLLTGTIKAEKLLGLTGNDTLIGGLGADTLTGGKGADVFKFNKVSDTGIDVKTRDTITDFKTTDGDKVDLSGIDANSKLTGDQAFTFIGSAAFSKTNAAGQLRFDATSKILYGSTDADAAPEFSIQLSGVSRLVVGDFVL
jgi:Ca2+-binding RTX toxin-like protein